MEAASCSETSVGMYHRSLLGPGSGGRDNVRPGRGSGLVQMISIKRYIEHFGLSRAILFSQRKSYS
jgi:hypothetical protein